MHKAFDYPCSYVYHQFETVQSCSYTCNLLCFILMMTAETIESFIYANPIRQFANHYNQSLLLCFVFLGAPVWIAMREGNVYLYI